MRTFNQLDITRSIVSPAVPGEYTGRYLVVLREDAEEEGTAALRSAGDLQVSSTADVDSGVLAQETIQTADAVVFHHLGVALVDSPSGIESVSSAAATNSAILAIEPERVCRAIQTEAAPGSPSSLDYLRGYQDGVRDALGRPAPAGQSVAALNRAGFIGGSGL